MAWPDVDDLVCCAQPQGQLVFEVGQLRGALLLAFPDHGRALRERGIPPKALGTAGDFAEAAGTPLHSARHQAWVQVGSHQCVALGEMG
jgi:hypothetical protein